jgi:hypothetical protein
VWPPEVSVMAVVPADVAAGMGEPPVWERYRDLIKVIIIIIIIIKVIISSSSSSSRSSSSSSSSSSRSSAAFSLCL